MSRRISIVLAGILLAALFVALGYHLKQKAVANREPSPPRIYCTTYPLYLFARDLTAGTDLEPILLLPAGTGCPHEISLTPRDLMKLRGDNVLLIANGAGLDDAIVHAARKANPLLKISNSARGLTCLPSSGSHSHNGKPCSGKDRKHEAEAEADVCGEGCSGEGHRHETESDTTHTDCEPESFDPNPHLFASPFTAKQVMENIASSLKMLSPESSETISENEQDLLKKFDTLCADFLAIKPKVEGKNVAAQHDVFEYLFAPLNLRTPVLLDAESGQSISPAEAAKIVKSIRELGIKVLFIEPQFSSDSAAMLAKEAGIEAVPLDPAASGPANPPRHYYFSLMRENLKTLQSRMEQP